MSFLYHKKAKKIINIAWGVVSVLVIIGMIIVYAPGILNLFLR